LQRPHRINQHSLGWHHHHRQVGPDQDQDQQQGSTSRPTLATRQQYPQGQQQYMAAVEAGQVQVQEPPGCTSHPLLKPLWQQVPLMVEAWRVLHLAVVPGRQGW
jgi:hypothetical protein